MHPQIWQLLMYLNNKRQEMLKDKYMDNMERLIYRRYGPNINLKFGIQFDRNETLYRA